MQYTQEQLQWLYTNNPDEYNRYVLAMQQAQQAPQTQVAAQAQVTQVAQAVAEVHAPAQTNMLTALAGIAAAAAEVEDHAEIRSGGLARAGVAWLRLLSYIEIGVHPKKNPNHTPSMVAIIEFELHHPDHVTEYEGVRKPRKITVRVPKTHGNNSGFPKFFKALQRAMGEQFTHISQMIGACCLGEIYHNKDATGKTWENLDLDGAWSFKSSLFQNPSTGQTEQVNIPELHGVPMLFIMDNVKTLENPQAMKMMWDSIFIEGTRKVGGGTTGKPETEISNNYYQEQLMSSINWETSQAKAVLDSVGCVTMTDEISRKKNSQATAPATQLTGAMNALPTLQAQPLAAAPELTPPQFAQPVQQAPALQPLPQGTFTAAPQEVLAQQIPDVITATPTAALMQPPMPQQVAPQQTMPQASPQVIPAQPVQVMPQAAPQQAAPQMAPQQATPQVLSPDQFMAQFATAQ